MRWTLSRNASCSSVNFMRGQKYRGGRVQPRSGHGAARKRRAARSLRPAPRSAKPLALHSICARFATLRCADLVQHAPMQPSHAGDKALPQDNALAGLRVLDFSIMLAGPYCTRLLADLGADVIKIEPPEGDDMRQRAPLRPGPAGPHSTYFGQLNAGKRSVALDLKHPDALALVRRLAEQCDVLVENFRPGVMQRLGLGYEALAALNPKLIYCSISGYGQTGPGAERAAYAMMVQAASGFDRSLMRYAGDRDRPAPSAVFIADVLGGLYACSAIQTALLQRARTQQGQRVDVALMDCMLNLLVYELQEAQFPVATPRPAYGPVRTRDGDVLIAPITQRNFEALCDGAHTRRELGGDDGRCRGMVQRTHASAMPERTRRRRRAVRRVCRPGRRADRRTLARTRRVQRGPRRRRPLHRREPALANERHTDAHARLGARRRRTHGRRAA